MINMIIMIVERLKTGLFLDPRYIFLLVGSLT